MSKLAAKVVTLVFLGAVVVGLIMVYVPACQPPDMGDCTRNSTTNRYTCPEESK